MNTSHNIDNTNKSGVNAEDGDERGVCSNKAASSPAMSGGPNYGTNPMVAFQSLLQSNPALAEIVLGKMQQQDQNPNSSHFTSPQLLQLVSTLLSGQKMGTEGCGFGQQPNPSLTCGQANPRASTLTAAAGSFLQHPQPQIQSGALHATLLQMGMLQQMQQQQQQQQRPLVQDDQHHQQQQQEQRRQMELLKKHEQLEENFDKKERIPTSQIQQVYIPVASKQQDLQDVRTPKGAIDGIKRMKGSNAGELDDDDMQRPTRLPCRARGMNLDHNFEVRRSDSVC
jgi:hypothetical protein